METKQQIPIPATLKEMTQDMDIKEAIIELSKNIKEDIKEAFKEVSKDIKEQTQAITELTQAVNGQYPNKKSLAQNDIIMEEKDNEGLSTKKISKKVI